MKHEDFQKILAKLEKINSDLESKLFCEKIRGRTGVELDLNSLLNLENVDERNLIFPRIFTDTQMQQIAEFILTNKIRMTFLIKYGKGQSDDEIYLCGYNPTLLSLIEFTVVFDYFDSLRWLIQNGMILEPRLDRTYDNLGECVLQIREFLSIPRPVIHNLNEKAKKIFEEYEFSFTQKTQHALEKIYPPHSSEGNFLCKKALPLVTSYLGFVTKYKTVDNISTKDAVATHCKYE